MEVILYGEGRDQKFSSQMVDALRLRYSTLFFGKHFLSSTKPSSSLLLFEETQKLKISSDNCLVILRERADVSKLKLLNSNIPVLVYSNHQRQIEALSKRGYQAITCGLLEKDTLNFSSLGEDFSMITLQRSLHCFHKSVEPMDVPLLHPKDFSPYLLLSLTAIALFLESPEELELNFRTARSWQ